MAVGHAMAQSSTTSPIIPNNLIGEPALAMVKFDDVPCQCLIDTGSQVSTVSEGFYNTYLSQRELKDIHGLIGVTGAGGHRIPYLGYIEVDVSLDGNTLAALVLVVPETDYHQSTPGLLGTNIIASVQLNQSTSEALSKAISAVKLQQRHLAANNGRYGNIIMDHELHLQPMTTQLIDGRVKFCVTIARQTAIVEPDASLEECKGVSLMPGMIEVHDKMNCLPVEVVNNTDEEVVIPA